jgi:hypothetical protein
MSGVVGKLNVDLQRQIHDFVGSGDALDTFRMAVVPELIKKIRFLQFKFDQTCTVRNYSERTFKCVKNGRIYGSYRREGLLYLGKKSQHF